MFQSIVIHLMPIPPSATHPLTKTEEAVFAQRFRPATHDPTLSSHTQ